MNVDVDMSALYKVAEQSIRSLRTFRKPLTTTVDLEIDRFSEDAGFYFIEGNYKIRDVLGLTIESGRFKIKIESFNMKPVDISIHPG